jgi:hypothetical protein
VTDTINYVDQIVAALAERLDDCEIDLLRQYALLVLVTGEQTTEQDAHDAWAAWRTATNPRHRLLVPFHHLPAEEQALNTPYAEALFAVMASWAEMCRPGRYGDSLLGLANDPSTTVPAVLSLSRGPARAGPAA